MTTTDHISWVREFVENELQVCVNLELYTRDALFRVCYVFTDRCYLFLELNDAGDEVIVHFNRKTKTTDLVALAGEFANELINQRIREEIARETRPIRELIIAQAFAEADLLDRTDEHASYVDDPRHIAG